MVEEGNTIVIFDGWGSLSSRSRRNTLI